jgi:hypothetical protein
MPVTPASEGGGRRIASLRTAGLHSEILSQKKKKAKVVSVS